MQKLRIKARGKINLALDILGKRPDGYHEVDMVLQSIDLSDEILLQEGPAGIRMVCDDPSIPQDEENLAVRAALLLQGAFPKGKGLSITLNKRIPASAGLAGGSADAAAVLAGIRRLWALDLTNTELSSLGLKLGADVPFCLTGGTARVRGIGEVVTPIEGVAPMPLILVKPPFSMSTAAAYSGYRGSASLRRPDIAGLLPPLLRGDAVQMAPHMANVLESVTLLRYPLLVDIKEALLRLKAAAVMMSGSGPTVFGLFSDKQQAAEAFSNIREGYGAVYWTETAAQGIEFLEGGRVSS